MRSLSDLIESLHMTYQSKPWVCLFAGFLLSFSLLGFGIDVRSWTFIVTGLGGLISTVILGLKKADEN